MEQSQQKTSMVPATVRDHVKYVLNQLRAHEAALHGVQLARGNGHILSLELKDREKKIKRELDALEEFRGLAAKNGVDGEAFIKAHGGVPDLTRFGYTSQSGGKQSTAPLYWVYHLTDTRETAQQAITHNHALLDVKGDAIRAAALLAASAAACECEYRLVAEVEAAGLEDVFRLTNTIESPWWRNPGVHAKFPGDGCRSTSTGDIVVDQVGMGHFCDRIGWISLGLLNPA